MSVEIDFPLEFLVEGVPVSLGASPRSREQWKSRVSGAARIALQEGYWATLEPVAVTIFYFPRTSMEGDIDNIVKPILDALCGLAYMDDQQVVRLVVQKFEPHRISSLSGLTPCLVQALLRDEPLVYLRIELM